MVISLMASIIAATVVLVPKTGTIEKAQVAIPQESVSEIPAEAKSISKKEDKEGVITLRKVKKSKVAKNSKGKKGRKNSEKEGPKTEFDNENLDDIYKKERKYFEKGQASNSKKHKGGVKGPLASIPAAVANSIASNIAVAKAARTPAKVEPPPPPKPQTPEELFNVEPTFQEPVVQVKDLPTKLPKKKIVSKEIKKKEFKEFKEIEVKKELEDEVLLAANENPAKEEIKDSRKPASTKAEATDLLQRVEKKYVTHFIKIKINSEVTQALLERTKTYSGDLYLAPESRFKMEISEPNKHMLLMNGKNIWVVDYPLDGMQDKVQILHSKSAKNLKNQAFLDIFSGVGNLQKRFKIESSDKKDDEITYKLIPKKKDEQIERVELQLDAEAELISAITFWDSLGNKTQLKFSKQEFEDKTPKDLFNFTPPKDASITNL